MGAPVQPGLFLASLADFSLGMNSDVPPIALPLNQAAFITNGTVRGNFITQRSAYQDFTLTFTDESVQSAFESGYFQDAEVYNPDSGNDCVIASISGRLFKVTPDAAASATVEEITGDTGGQVPTASQCWLWQGENFMFWNDGTSRPVVYDNQTTFRLAGEDIIATVATGASIAAGASALVTLTAPYTGLYNVPVNVFNTDPDFYGQFQVQGLASGYGATITNVNDTVGATHDIGDDFIVPGSYNGQLTSGGAIPPHSPGFVLGVDSPYTGPVGGMITIGGIKLTVVAVDLFVPNITVANNIHNNGDNQINLVAGTNFSRFPSVADQTVATLLLAFNAPAVASSTVVNLEAPYAGPPNAVVRINDAIYTISTTEIAPSTQVYLYNLGADDLVVSAGFTLRTIAQLPPGRVGVYGLGRNWICLTDGLSYLGSDIVGSESGTVAYAFRDSILNVTENTFLAGGGVFRVPSSGQRISTMSFPATLDSSLGQGPLQVLTPDVTFSCNAPVERDVWQDMQNPIQTQSLVGGGALGDCVAINGDLWFRSAEGIRSLRLARQEFQTSWSNTPQSTEVNRVLLSDDPQLLQWWHGANFDNRALFVANPQSSDRGTYHTKLIALNLDPNSSLGQKQSPVYDGAWQGLNILKILAGTFGVTKRCFAFTYNATTDKIGFAEILRSPDESSNDRKLDNGEDRIQLSFETPGIFAQPDTRTRELLKLASGEIFVKDLVGTVQFKVEFRPDWLSTWTTWHEWEVTDSPTFQPRMGLGTPPITGDNDTQRPNCVGYHFQLRITILGPMTFMGGNFFATVQPVTTMAPPIVSTGLTTLTV